MWLFGRVFRPERECAGDLGLNREATVGSVWLTGFLGFGNIPLKPRPHEGAGMA